MEKKKLAGRTAEVQCVEYLRARGYRPVAMNYTCRGGEIDIIAEYVPRRGVFKRSAEGFIVFVEVKQRADRKMGEAREAVNARKRERIKLAARYYLAANETELQPRFDVMEVYPGTDGPEIIHLENAFE